MPMQLVEPLFCLRPHPMSDFLTQILIPLTVGSSVLLILLTTALCAERVARNRRERLAGERRTSYGEILAAHNPFELEQLADRAARAYASRCDLVDSLVLTRWSTGPVFAGHSALSRAVARDTVNRDSARRGVGAALLGVIGGAEAAALATRLMREDPDIELRLIAARALRVIGDDLAARDLLGGLRDGVLPTARLVEQLGRPFAARAMVEALPNEEFHDVRGDIAEALGLAGWLPAAQAIALLATGGGERERIKACRALGRLGDPLVVPIPDPRARRRGLGRSGAGRDRARRLRARLGRRPARPCARRSQLVGARQQCLEPAAVRGRGARCAA